MDPALQCLSLDISTYTGFAVTRGQKFLTSGVQDFSKKLGQHNGHKGIKFYNFLQQIVKDYGLIDVIFFEEVMFGGEGTNDGRETYLGLKMVMNMFCAGLGIPAYPIYPTTVKKQFAGHGRAEKGDMCRAARELGWKGGAMDTAQLHDEADAIGIMAVMMRNRYGVTPRF